MPENSIVSFLNSSAPTPRPGEFVSGESPYKPEYYEFTQLNPGRGSLKVQVSTAREAFPIKDVVVDVAVEYMGKRYTIYNDLTDSSGIVDKMVLPARPSADSLNSKTAFDEARYLVSLYSPYYNPVNNYAVTVYDNIETILPISLIPIARDEVNT